MRIAGCRLRNRKASRWNADFGLLITDHQSPITDHDCFPSFLTEFFSHIHADLRTQKPQASAQGEGGEIFILDMGTPVKIVDMARDLIRLSGFKPDADIEIKFIGLRPGEKLYEELITEGEGIVKTPHEKLFVLRANSNIDPGWLSQKIKELALLAHEQDGHGINPFDSPV